MDLQTGSASTSDAQHPGVEPDHPPLEHWSSTSSQSSPSREVLSVSSLVPSTVFALVPHCRPLTNGNPEPPALPETASAPRLLGSSSASSGARDENTSTSPLPCSDHLQGVQPRKPSDGGPLEEGSVGLMVPKEQESGMGNEACWCVTELGMRPKGRNICALWVLEEFCFISTPATY